MLKIFKQYIHTKSILLLLTSLIIIGCASSPAVPKKIFDTIIIENSTGVYIQRVTITEINMQGQGKTGSLSPVPIHAKQIFTRGDKAQSLSSTLRVSWIDANNKNYSKDLSIKKILSSQNLGATLLLKLIKDGQITVSVEKK